MFASVYIRRIDPTTTKADNGMLCLLEKNPRVKLSKNRHFAVQPLEIRRYDPATTKSNNGMLRLPKKHPCTKVPENIHLALQPLEIPDAASI